MVLDRVDSEGEELFGSAGRVGVPRPTRPCFVATFGQVENATEVIACFVGEAGEAARQACYFVGERQRLLAVGIGGRSGWVVVS